MTTMLEKYLTRVRHLMAFVKPLLTEAEQREVWHLIDHGEPAEGLRALAWIVVEKNKRLPSCAITEIRVLTSGLVDAADLPDDLDRFASD